jgi:hydroxyacylglutathione hydrolase
MTLDDTTGDILRKARISAQATVEAAAAAAGLSKADYEALEATGKAGKVDWKGVGQLLSLNGDRLARIAGGWLPAPTTIETWRELRVIETVDASDGLKVNAYLVWDEVTREAALFDTGLEAGPVLGLIGENQLTLKHIFITHSHYDHIQALPAIREKFPRARVHSSAKSAPVDQRNLAHDFIMLGSLRITNRPTPGHAEDGVTYVVGNWPEDGPPVAVVGDAIFAGSIGGAREHLAQARAAIQEQIFSLPGDTLICPGHGPLSTVSQERENNPWFL